MNMHQDDKSFFQVAFGCLGLILAAAVTLTALMKLWHWAVQQ